MAGVRTPRSTRPAAAALSVLAMAACASPPRESFDSPDPAARRAAIVRAAAEEDTTKVPDLVRMLDSDDPAVRLLAIGTLQRLTGETLGYDYAAPARDRDEAVQRWVSYAERSAGGATE